MKRQPVILIFDIGKTTKKALVFDPSFNVLEEQTEIFEETTDEEGFPAENLPAVSDWVKAVFRSYSQHPSFMVTHCNFSAYGASLVHLDNNNNLITPFFNYLKPLPQICLESFKKKYDSDESFAATTASPYLGLLNSGLQLFWLKENKPEMFKRIKTSLHLPQYFSFLLSNHTATEITSVGCHTMMWDFGRQGYHEWVRKEDFLKYFPPIESTEHVIDLRGKDQGISMGIGIHDSSAALMPYLATQKEQFMLLSSGTWNICFNPFNTSPLTKRELESDCLCYLTYQASPVKASRIFLGHEHEMQAKLLIDFFKVSPDAYKKVAFQEGLYQQLVMEDSPEKAFYPVGMEGTGPLPLKPTRKTDFSSFGSFEQAYHQLVRYLVRWQLISIDLIDPEFLVGNIIVVGGFTKNRLFLEILKREEPRRQVLISDHPRASALGAAWVVYGKGGYLDKGQLLSVASYA